MSLQFCSGAATSIFKKQLFYYFIEEKAQFDAKKAKEEAALLAKRLVQNDSEVRYTPFCE